MKNYIRKDRNTNLSDLDMEKNEQKIPMSYDEEAMGRNMIRPPVTQVPSRNQNFNNDLSRSLHQQQYQEPPLYVPPFLLNNNRQSRHNHGGPSDYLPWSIANIFICVIIALPALFFSVQVRDLKKAGNVKKAKVNSRRSLILNIVASVVGLLTILIALILRFALYQLIVNADVNSQNVPLKNG